MKIICPKCKGSGEQVAIIEAIMTSGLTLLYGLIDREISHEKMF